MIEYHIKRWCSIHLILVSCTWLWVQKSPNVQSRFSFFCVFPFLIGSVFSCCFIYFHLRMSHTSVQDIQSLIFYHCFGIARSIAKSVKKLTGATYSYVNRLKQFWKGSSSMRSMWKDVSGHHRDNLRIQFDSTKWFVNLSSLFYMSECERVFESLLCVIPETAGNRLQRRLPRWVQEKQS